ncbi:MAG: type III-B CRISPR module RAMP protein Cmr4 [Candidatus Omnitrophica bacterium]|nr:type III-B CRISPR module RAMP protein Cmr4 [Candidatus Omnitrophota bacterium]
MRQKILYLFTRTPLHIGAGLSSGLIDHPVLRERHTALPIIPGSTLKGAFAGQWTEPAPAPSGGGKTIAGSPRQAEGTWLFGAAAGDETGSSPGALQFSEAKLLAFPIRSARGGFGWITSPLVLQRFARDGGMKGYKEDGQPDYNFLPKGELREDQALFSKTGPLSISDRVVFEEYAFNYAGELPGSAGQTPGLADHLRAVLPRDPVWSEVSNRLAVVNDGILCYFSQTACEFVQHASIDKALGITQPGGVFSQENVPGETMFYACLNCFDERGHNQPKDQPRPPDEAFSAKLLDRGNLLQFGADASTGLGYCTVELKDSVR